MIFNSALLAALTGNLAAFISGCSLSWTSPEIAKLNSTDGPLERTLTSEESSWISSLLPLGAMLGPLIFSFLSEKIGRKLSILSLSVPFLICYVSLSFSKVIGLFYFGRIMAGLGIGGAFTILSVYSAEIAEDSNRGAYGSMMNCFVCSGLLFSYSVGPYIEVMPFNIVLLAIPILLLISFFFFGVETPHYYIGKGDKATGRQMLIKLRGKENVDEELNIIEAEINEAGKGNLMDIFKSKGLIKASLITVGLMTFQQFSGINAVLFFAQTIFKDAGTPLEPEVCSILVGLTQFITSFISPLLSDRLGRKFLLIFSAVGMLIAEVPLGIFFILKKADHDVDSISFLPILCLILYIVTYNSGYGPLPWSVMGEMFPSNVKAPASTVISAVCWFEGFLVTKFFQSISDGIGSGPSFLIFAGFCLAASVFSIFYVVETKGKNLQEIQEALNS